MVALGEVLARRLGRRCRRPGRGGRGAVGFRTRGFGSCVVWETRFRWLRGSRIASMRADFRTSGRADLEACRPSDGNLGMDISNLDMADIQDTPGQTNPKL